MSVTDKLKVASKLLDDANKNFDKNHYAKVEKAKNIIDEIIEEDNYVRARNKSE